MLHENWIIVQNRVRPSRKVGLESASSISQILCWTMRFNPYLWITLGLVKSRELLVWSLDLVITARLSCRKLFDTRLVVTVTAIRFWSFGNIIAVDNVFWWCKVLLTLPLNTQSSMSQLSFFELFLTLGGHVSPLTTRRKPTISYFLRVIWSLLKILLN